MLKLRRREPIPLSAYVFMSCAGTLLCMSLYVFLSNTSLTSTLWLHDMYTIQSILLYLVKMYKVCPLRIHALSLHKAAWFWEIHITIVTWRMCYQKYCRNYYFSVTFSSTWWKTWTGTGRWFGIYWKSLMSEILVVRRAHVCLDLVFDFTFDRHLTGRWYHIRRL